MKPTTNYQQPLPPKYERITQSRYPVTNTEQPIPTNYSAMTETISSRNSNRKTIIQKYNVSIMTANN